LKQPKLADRMFKIQCLAWNYFNNAVFLQSSILKITMKLTHQNSYNFYKYVFDSSKDQSLSYLSTFCNAELEYVISREVGNGLNNLLTVYSKELDIYNAPRKAKNICANKNMICIEWHTEVFNKINKADNCLHLQQNVQGATICQFSEEKILAFSEFNNLPSLINTEIPLQSSLPAPAPAPAPAPGPALALFLKKMPLSKRELQCLSLWMIGITAKETGKILSISARTIEQYRENIKIKLRLTTRSEIWRFLRSHQALNDTINYAYFFIQE